MKRTAPRVDRAPLAIAVAITKDSKLGMCSATHASQASCPPDCPIAKECYANFGHQAFTTNRLNRASDAWEATARAMVTPEDVARDEAAAIDALRSRLDLRVHIVGDCRTIKAARIVSAACDRYRARTNAMVWTYSHAWRKVPRAAWGTVSVLASVESIPDARRAMARGYAAAVIVPAFPANGRAFDVDGIKVIPCPNQVQKAAGNPRPIQCVDCRLCLDDKALLARKAVIGFEPHGTKRSALLAVLAQ